MNRAQAPKIKSIEKINIVEAQKYTLDNGISVFLINTGSQAILRTDFIFDAGTWQQEKFFQAALTNDLLREGTQEYTSSEIAKRFDFLGTFYGNETNRNSASISFYSLHKFYKESIDIVEEIIKHPLFPQKEFNLKLRQKKQQFQLNRQKVESLATLKYFECLFGKENPYGNSPVVEDFDLLTKKDLEHYHKAYYHSGNIYILLAGKNPQKFLPILNKKFGQLDWESPQLSINSELKIKSAKPECYLVEKKDAKQSAIRAGMLLPENTSNKELYHLLIFNTLLGGYFGSRLMQNLREDKGYTYGISSFIRQEKLAQYFMIATNVGSEYTKAAINEIKKEFKELLIKGFSEKELKLVQKQMTGDLLSLFDGAFAQIEAFNDVYELGKNYKYYNELFEQIKTAKPQQIMESAKKYFSVDNLLFAVAGKL